MRSSFQPRFLLQHGSNTAIGRISWSGYHHSTPEQSTEARPYGSYALVYLLEGEGRYWDARGVAREVHAGDLIITFPEIARRYGPLTGQTWNEIYIIFDGPVFDLWRGPGLLDPAQPIRRLEPVDYWSRRIEEVVTRHDAGGPHALERIGALQELLGELVRYWGQQEVASDGRAWLERAYAMLEGVDPCEAPDYGELASRQGMSYEGFRKRFTQLAGLAPGQYLAKSKIRKASKLLEQTDMKLHQIAERCGFSDEFHLSKRFKQLTGITPREFRRWAHTDGKPL